MADTTLRMTAEALVPQKLNFLRTVARATKIPFDNLEIHLGLGLLGIAVRRRV